ncbi:MAG: AI-2E family transporter [Candidatus Saccharibacteria bacterium]
MKDKIEFDTRTFIIFWLIGIGIWLSAQVVFAGIGLASAALAIIGTSFIFAVILSPPVNRLAKILPSKSRVLSTAIAYITVIILLSFIVFLVIPPIIEQTVLFIQNIPKLVDSAVNQSAWLTDLIHHYNLQSEVNSVLDSIKNSATHFASGIGPILVASVGNFFSILTASILIIVLSFLMLVEGPLWLNRLWGLYTNKERKEHHKKLLGDMYGVATSYVTGQLTVSAIDGLMSGITVFVLSMFFNVPINLAIPATAIVFVASLVPVFGAMVGGIIVSIVLALNSIPAAVIFLVFFILYQQIEANYISPTIQSKHIALSPLAILTAVTIGIYMFGIVGGIISIPIAGSIKVILEDYLLAAKNKRLKIKESV